MDRKQIDPKRRVDLPEGVETIDTPAGKIFRFTVKCGPEVVKHHFVEAVRDVPHELLVLRGGRWNLKVESPDVGLVIQARQRVCEAKMISDAWARRAATAH